VAPHPPDGDASNLAVYSDFVPTLNNRGSAQAGCGD
jgi:hypothetical protein